jgi:hypothetical protein
MAELVERIGGVRYQLAQGNFRILIQRMRQNMEELFDLGLKRKFLLIGHGKLREPGPLGVENGRPACGRQRMGSKSRASSRTDPEVAFSGLFRQIWRHESVILAEC